MEHENKRKICPVEKAGELDTTFRKIIQNPSKILRPFIIEGMNVLDLGCGPGFFTIAAAELLKGKGKVTAADIQEGMLDIVKKKSSLKKLDQIIQIHKCQGNGIQLEGIFDFILAFYVIHEMPAHDNLFLELKSILAPGGKILIVEPNFHVTAKEFRRMKISIEKAGFKYLTAPGYFFCRSVLLTHADNEF